MTSVEQALLLHGAALRALARTLVAEQQVDDLLQETALQALQRPGLQPRFWRGWLQAILRHMASNQRRGRQRQLRHEAQAPPPRPQPAPAEAAQHRDTLQRLTAALTGLPEPYQATLLLRFFEDLPPSAIAAKTSVPLATVKSRLQRGLQLLRQRLEAEGGDWRPALAAALGLKTGHAAATAAATGVLLMGTGAKLAISGAAALLALAAWLLVAGNPPPEGAAPTAVRAPSSPRAADAAAGGGPVAAAQRSEATLPGGATASDAAILRGRCVDEYGRPLPRCEVELRRAPEAEGENQGNGDGASAYGRWLAEHPDRGFRNVLTASDTDGRFAFALQPPPLAFELRLRRDSLDHVRPVGALAAGATTDLGDLVLPITCTVTGRVVDSDGKAVRRPLLGLVRPGDAGTPRQRTDAESHADGTFEARVLAGHLRVAVDSRTVVRGGTVDVPVGLGSLPIEVVVAAVPASDTITGTVVDAAGTPMPGATVQAVEQGTYARTDAEGSFELVRSRRGGGVNVMLFASGSGRSSKLQPCAWGARDVQLSLGGEPGSNLELRVIAPDGTPVPDFTVRAFPPDKVYRMRAPSGHHDGGIARWPGLPATVRFLLVEPDRWDLWHSGFVALPGTRSAEMQLTVQLPAAAERLLRVLRSDGAPAAGVAVELLDPSFSPPNLAAAVDTIETVTNPLYKGYGPGYRQVVLALQRGRTDANGELRLHGPSATKLAVRLPGPGHPPLLLGDVSLDTEEPLLATLPAGCRLQGRLAPAELVRELRKRCQQQPESGFRLRRGDGPAATFVPALAEPGVAPDAEGAFAIDGLEAGDWQLALARWDTYSSLPMNLEDVATVELRAGHTASVQLNLPGWTSGLLDAQVLRNGEPFADGRIGIEVDDGLRAIVWGASTDRDGRFTARPRQGSVRVAVSQLVTRFGHMRQNHVFARERVFVGSGQPASAVFHLDVGRVRLRVRDAAGQAMAGVAFYLRSTDGALHATEESDADGRIELDVEPAAFDVLVMPRSLAELDRKLFAGSGRAPAADLVASLLHAGTVTALAGEVVECDVQLPAAWNR